MDTQPAPLDDVGGTDPCADFRVDSPRQIIALMRELNNSGAPVQLSSPSGESLDTLIWSVDNGSICMPTEGDHPRLQALIESDEVTAVAYLHAVKLQFDLSALVVVHARQASAIQAGLPRRVYRFQRRQAFRVCSPDRLPPRVFLRHPSIPDMQLTLRVLDLSIGGCALLVPSAVPELRAGSTLHDVRIELDPDNQFSASLRLLHIASIQPHTQGLRLGCELIELDSRAERTLQRYIDQTQKLQRPPRLG